MDTLRPVWSEGMDLHTPDAQRLDQFNINSTFDQRYKMRGYLNRWRKVKAMSDPLNPDMVYYQPDDVELWEYIWDLTDQVILGNEVADEG